jgi:hypothetical protein
MKTLRCVCCYSLAIALMCSLAGCNSEKLPGLGTVTGTVTMDGKPVPDAMISFEPTTPGMSAALGKTEANGNYELYYSRGHKGAPLGENIVKITTFGETGDEDNRQVRKETVPTKYNVKSELKADVKRGSNKFDFDLKSGGEVYQPGEPEKKGKKGRSPTGCG